MKIQHASVMIGSEQTPVLSKKAGTSKDESLEEMKKTFEPGKLMV